MYRIFLNFAKIASYPAYQNLILRKNFIVPFLKCKALKPEIKGVFAGHSVAMVTYRATKMIPTCSLQQFFDTMIVASSDNEW